jgi:hypothetical protein
MLRGQVVEAAGKLKESGLATIAGSAGVLLSLERKK